VGATRPPVLQHWVDEERLIGQTGKTVRPNVLFSVGTSGAVQYTAGIMEAETIVAINRDPNSPIFQLAHLGVVADAKTFLPVLTAKIRQTAMRKLVDALNRDEKADTRDGFGAKIRRLRESHKWSVEALAQATGQSPEFVERVENDDVAPPVSFLLRFANALKVDPGTFLRREEKAAIRNQRVQAFAKRTQDYSYQTLSPGAESDHLRAFMITIEPRQAHKPIAYKHEGEEFIFVTDGDLHLTLGNKTHKLRPGESMHFNSDVPHKLKSISNESTRCLVVLYTP
jgi:electron transfer flavoprotein alpha subunit